MLQRYNRYLKHTLFLLVLGTFVLSLLPAQEVEARKGFGGGFGKSSFKRSASGFSKRGFSNKRRTSGRSLWGRSSERARSTSKWSGGNISRRVGSKGNVFNSRGKAEGAYRKNLKTSWKSKPSTRPDYVPRRYSKGGRDYDVIFRNGRYGYWGQGNTWVALAAGGMLANSALMANRGYYYGALDSRNSRGSGIPWFVIFLGLFFFVNFAGKMTRRRH